MTINCNGKLIDVSHPKIMGILNITPDSFFDGGHYNDTTSILKQVEKMLLEGATFIDVGACSSRPGSMAVTEEEELKRLIQVVELLVSTFPDIILSIDTFRGKVAALALEAGAGMINDISAWNLDHEMLETIKKFQPPYVLMHMKGHPKNMQSNPTYKNLIKEILSFLIKKIELLDQIGIKDVLLDPGFGFGKTLEHNFSILRNLESFKTLNTPILVGISRKSMITNHLKINKINSLNGTTALNMNALSKGAKVLRVHDVLPAMECISLHEKIKNSKR